MSPIRHHSFFAGATEHWDEIESAWEAHLAYRNRVLPLLGRSLPEIIKIAIQHAAARILRECENTLREERDLPRIGEGWVSETELFKKLVHAFPDEQVTHHGRPGWLRPQHLDIYLPLRDIAIEYQGSQHRQPTAYFGGDAAFKKQQDRDARKFRLCAKNGCRLFYVYEGYTFDDVRRTIADAILETAANDSPSIAGKEIKQTDTCNKQVARKVGLDIVAELTSTLSDDEIASWNSETRETLKSLVPQIAEELRSSKPGVRYKAISGIHALGEAAEGAVPTMIEALRDPCWESPVPVIVALGKIGKKARLAIPAIRDAIHDPMEAVRASAIESLSLIETDLSKLIPKLVESLSDEGFFVRRTAALALGAIGPDAQVAVPALNQAVNDPNEYVREAAYRAISDICNPLKKIVPTRHGGSE